VSSGEFEELTPDRPAWTDWFGGQQLASNTHVIRWVPSAAFALREDELSDGAEHRPPLVEQMPLDLCSFCWKYRRESRRDIR